MHRHVRYVDSISLVAICLISMTLLSPALPAKVNTFVGQQAPTTIFHDNFGSYPATAKCDSVKDDCDALPSFGSPTSLPHYWIVASSAACLSRGGCVTWGKNDQMGPGSVAAVVTEQAAPGDTQSAKLGASDWYADKTSMAVWLDPSQVLVGQPITYSYKVWLSAGIDNPPAACNVYGFGPNNVLNTLTSFGQIRYYGNFGGTKGVWQISGTSTSSFINLGTYYLTTQSWHTLSFTVSADHSNWVSLAVDGQLAFDLSGYATTGGIGSYVDFATFIVPYCDYQSITSAVAHGFPAPLYAYVDDVEVMLGEPTLSSTASATLSSQSSSASLVSSTGTSMPNTFSGTSTSNISASSESPSNQSPIPGFPFESILIGFLIALAALGIGRRRRRR